MEIRHYQRMKILRYINPLLRNVVKWSDILQKSCSIRCKIFKVCLTILQYCEVTGQRGTIDSRI